MRSNILKSIVVFFVATSLLACHKEKGTIDPATRPSPPPGSPPAAVGGFLFDNKEYFWELPWTKDSNYFHIEAATQRLTDSALKKGIRVYAAIYSDWSPFTPVPSTLNDFSMPDTVNFSYTAVPGHIQVIARAPFNLTWNGDIQIEYIR